MRAGGAVFADADMPLRNVNVVVHHQQVFRRDLEIVGKRHNGLAAQVHIGLRHGQDHLLAAYKAFADEGVVALAADGHVQLFAQRLQHVKTYVVARVRILGAGIAQSYDQIHGVLLLC